MMGDIERRFCAFPEDRLAGLVAGFAAKKAGKFLAGKYGPQAVELVSKSPTGAGVVSLLDEAGVLKQLGVRPGGSWKDRLVKKLDEDIDLGGGVKINTAQLVGANLGAKLSPDSPFADYGLGADDEPLRGTLLRYGERAQMPGFVELFEPRAFGDLAERDVILNLFHRRDRPIVRTGGGGLILEEDGPEIRALIDFPPTRDGEDAAELICRGIIRGLSVEFRAIDEAWDGNLRRIKEAELLGAGLVDSPAYTGSRIAQRALERAAGREYATEKDLILCL